MVAATLSTSPCSDFKLAAAVTALSASQGPSSLGDPRVPCLPKSVWLLGESITLDWPVNTTYRGQVN